MPFITNYGALAETTPGFIARDREQQNADAERANAQSRGMYGAIGQVAGTAGEIVKTRYAAKTAAARDQTKHQYTMDELGQKAAAKQAQNDDIAAKHLAAADAANSYKSQSLLNSAQGFDGMLEDYANKHPDWQSDPEFSAIYSYRKAGGNDPKFLGTAWKGFSERNWKAIDHVNAQQGKTNLADQKHQGDMEKQGLVGEQGMQKQGLAGEQAGARQTQRDAAAMSRTQAGIGATGARTAKQGRPFANSPLADLIQGTDEPKFDYMGKPMAANGKPILSRDAVGKRAELQLRQSRVAAIQKKYQAGDAEGAAALANDSGLTPEQIREIAESNR